MALDGVTLVISPLIALMKDHDSLAAKGVAAERLDSTLDMDEDREVMRRLRQSELKPLYVAPERINNERFRESIGGCRVAMVVVDEAAGVRHRYTVLKQPADRQALIDEMAGRMQQRKELEIGRLGQIVELLGQPECLAAALCSHFGEELESACGSCSSCQGRPAELPPAASPCGTLFVTILSWPQTPKSLKQKHFGSSSLFRSPLRTKGTRHEPSSFRLTETSRFALTPLSSFRGYRTFDSRVNSLRERNNRPRSLANRIRAI